MNMEYLANSASAGKSVVSYRDVFTRTSHTRDLSLRAGLVLAACECDQSRGPATGLLAKRLYDIGISFIGLLVLSPVLALIALLLKIADNGTILYRQFRVGRGGREFVIYKFRTMVPASGQAGPSVTKGGDARVTRIGWLLRRSKLDELPQLWNVLRGDMSLVGPRPEVGRYVSHYTPAQRAILRHKPGITDLASLCFRDEETLLANADNVEDFYIRYCIPRKLELNEEYAKHANIFSDTWILLQTVFPYSVRVLASYAVILAGSFCLSYELINDFSPADLSAPFFMRELALTLAFQLACLAWRRQCRGLLSYFSSAEFRQIGAALGLAAMGLLAWSAASQAGPPLNFILVNALVSLCLLGGFRGFLQHRRERSHRSGGSLARPARVGIVGAGEVGAHIADELTRNRRLGRTVVAFFDDDSQKWQKDIHNVPVAGMPECLLNGWSEKLDEVVIALPDTRKDRVKEIERLLGKTRLRSYRVAELARFWNRPHAA
jgi:lipopolysaccharide/colanic/teichoic acid biosynthesis glycosyltransferase